MKKRNTQQTCNTNDQGALDTLVIIPRRTSSCKDFLLVGSHNSRELEQQKEGAIYVQIVYEVGEVSASNADECHA